MKDGRDKTGLNILKEKPLSIKNFAIIQKIQRDAKRSVMDSLDEEPNGEDEEEKSPKYTAQNRKILSPFKDDILISHQVPI